MRKLTAIFLVACMLLAMGGCSTGSKNETKDTMNTGSKDNNGTPAKADKDITLNFLIMSDIEPLKPVFDEFTALNPGVKISVEVVSFDEIFETTEVRLGSKEDSIDMLLVDAPMIANYAAKDYLADMGAFIPATSRDNITEASLEAGMIDDKLVALPLYSSCVNLYYNKAIFDEKNVEYPANDVNDRWTWEKVVEAAKQLTYDKDGKKIFGLSFEQISRPYQLLPLAHSLGATQFISNDGSTVKGYTNSDKMVEAAQFYYDTFNTWNVSPKISADEAVGYFTGGQVAMFIGGSWQISAMEAAGMNFGFAPHPYFEGGTPATPTGSWYAGVSNYSKNKEMASKFIEFLTTEDATCQKTYDIMGNLPCNITVLKNIEENPAYNDFPKNVVKLNVYEAMNTAMARPKMVGYEEWQTVMQNTYNDIMNGSDPKTALDAATEEIDSLIAKYQQ